MVRSPNYLRAEAHHHSVNATRKPTPSAVDAGG